MATDNQNKIEILSGFFINWRGDKMKEKLNKLVELSAELGRLRVNDIECEIFAIEAQIIELKNELMSQYIVISHNDLWIKVQDCGMSRSVFEAKFGRGEKNETT